MALPKKRRRTTTVDGTTYHYCIRLNESGRGVIQHGNGNGACLFIFPHAIMQPKHVADAIRFGIERGWKPGVSGDDVWLAFDSDADNNSLLEFIPSDDFRVITYNTNGELQEKFDSTRFPDTRKWYERKISPDNVG
ncbi:unnamed protein product [Ectocarpus sp. 4 AP-2014]